MRRSEYSRNVGVQRCSGPYLASGGNDRMESAKRANNGGVNGSGIARTPSQESSLQPTGLYARPGRLANVRGQTLDMVIQESLPSLGRWLPMLGHQSGYRALGNLHSQLEQFPVNARGAPVRVRGRHPLD